MGIFFLLSFDHFKRTTVFVCLYLLFNHFFAKQKHSILFENYFRKLFPFLLKPSLSNKFWGIRFDCFWKSFFSFCISISLRFYFAATFRLVFFATSSTSYSLSQTFTFIHSLTLSLSSLLCSGFDKRLFSKLRIRADIKKKSDDDVTKPILKINFFSTWVKILRPSKKIIRPENPISVFSTFSTNRMKSPTLTDEDFD